MFISLFGFGPPSQMRLMYSMNRDLPQFGFEFEKIKRFNPESKIKKINVIPLIFKIVKFTTNFHISKKAIFVTTASFAIIGFIAGDCFTIEL